MSLSPVRRVWRKFSGLSNNTPFRRRRSTVAAAAPEVQVVPDDHHRQSSCPFHHAGQKLATAAASANTINILPQLARASERKSRKSYEEIPTPKGFPIVGSALDLMSNGGAAKMHEYCDRRHKALGPIFRDKLGTVDCVIISGKEYIQMVYLLEGKYPAHLVPEAWLVYNEKTGVKRGLFFMEGDQWSKRRHLLNEVLMSPAAVSPHAESFNDVITDLLRRWDSVVANQGHPNSKEGTLEHLERELYNWSVESLGTMLFGKRLGCVWSEQHRKPAVHHEFVECVQQIFTESAKMTMIPPKLACMLQLPVWRRFYAAATKALKMARGYVEERMIEIEHLKTQGVPVTGVLSQLMAAKVPHDEIVSIIADLIIAAADTTSHATQWALHLLAKNPECQEKLLSEINNAVEPGKLIEEDTLDSIPYSMGIVKEALRLFPIASFLTRILPNDIVLGGYEIPAGKLIVMSQYTVGRDPDNFPNPEKFMPERWTNLRARRANGGSQGCVPFGVGARSCIGRRVAEVQMRLFICRAIQKFHLESANNEEVGIALRMITAPDTPIRLRLHKR